jgi:hypothetical protein
MGQLLLGQRKQPRARRTAANFSLRSSERLLPEARHDCFFLARRGPGDPNRDIPSVCTLSEATSAVAVPAAVPRALRGGDCSPLIGRTRRKGGSFGRVCAARSSHQPHGILATG